MREIRTLLVDDEPVANQGLRSLLARHSDFIVVGEYGDGASAARAVRRTSPDLIFLDAQMPEMDGFAMLRDLGADGLSLPLIVFVTAYDDYALRAFDVQATGYLLKPIDDERFDRTIARVRRQLDGERAADLQEHLAALPAE
ncbi:MAG TPA: response regulator, partial [Gemmatimonadaceae bacterium]